MKKFLAILLCAVILMSITVGCGGNSTSTKGTAEGTQTKTQEKVKLYFAYWDQNQKVGMDKIIEAFNKQEPNITIESTIITSKEFKTKLQTALPTGSGMDILWLSPSYTQEYANKGMLLDLQSYIDRDKVDLSNLQANILKMHTIGGKIYGIPKDLATISLFYNKALFDKAGVAYPNDTWTWKDLLDAATKLTTRTADGKVDQSGFYCENDNQDIRYDIIYQNQGKILTDDNMKAAFNTPETKGALQFLTDMMNVQKVSPTGKEMSEIDVDKYFVSGKIAMLGNGSWMAKPYFEGLGDKVDVAPLPQGKVRASMISGLAFGGATHTKHPEEVWKFLKFCATKEAHEAQSGVVIPAYKGAESLWLQQYPSMHLQVFLDAIQYSVPMPISAKNPMLSLSPFGEEMSKIWIGEKSIDQGLADAEKAVNAAINQ